MYQIHEGDQLYIEFKINNGDSKDSPSIDISTASAVEFAIDNVFKLWKPDGSGEVKYDETKKTFMFPVTQEESFTMKRQSQYQVRIKFTNGDVQASNIGIMDVKDTISRNIL